MGETLADFLTRLTSRKFLTSLLGAVIVMADAVGVGEFPDEVVAAAWATVITYLAVQGAQDTFGR